MSISANLQKIQSQIEQLKKDVISVEKLSIKVNFFDRSLFQSVPHEKQNELHHYMNEIELNFAYFSRSIESKTISTEKVMYLSQKLINQISALKREIAT